MKLVQMKGNEVNINLENWHQLGLWKESTDCRLWWNLVSLILWIFKKKFWHFYLQTESLSPRRSSVSHLKNPGGGFSDRTGSSWTHLRHSSVQSSQVCSSDIQIYTACKYVNILHRISKIPVLWCTKFKSKNH